MLGKQHPCYASSLSNLALFYYELGNYTQALPLIEQALSIAQQVFDENHLDVQNYKMGYEMCVMFCKQG